jgi:hypothetical protein
MSLTTVDSGLISSGAITLTTQVTGTLPEANGGTGTTVGYCGFKNRIINGAMVIDQRNAGASVTPTVNGTYTLDRWTTVLSQSSKYSVQQNAGSVTLPVGLSKYLGITSLSSYSSAAGDYFGVRQFIEGFNTADLQWGTANAKTVTLSFQVYSSLTGTFGGSFLNSAENRSYPFTYSIPVANTWTSISVTVAGDTSGTWVGATNGVGIEVIFNLGSGTTYSGTAGAWASALYLSATGAVSVVGTSGATFYITGVQLEKGSTATSFDYRPYGTELALCQRYYEIGGVFAFVGNVTTGNNYGARMTFKVTKRATPTMTYGDSANSGFPVGSAGDSTPGVEAYGAYKTCNATTTAGYWWATSTASAEL